MRGDGQHHRIGGVEQDQHDADIKRGVEQDLECVGRGDHLHEIRGGPGPAGVAGGGDGRFLIGGQVKIQRIQRGEETGLVGKAGVDDGPAERFGNLLDGASRGPPGQVTDHPFHIAAGGKALVQLRGAQRVDQRRVDVGPGQHRQPRLVDHIAHRGQVVGNVRNHRLQPPHRIGGDQPGAAGDAGGRAHVGKGKDRRQRDRHQKERHHHQEGRQQQHQAKAG